MLRYLYAYITHSFFSSFPAHTSRQLDSPQQRAASPRVAHRCSYSPPYSYRIWLIFWYGHWWHLRRFVFTLPNYYALMQSCSSAGIVGIDLLIADIHEFLDIRQGFHWRVDDRLARLRQQLFILPRFSTYLTLHAQPPHTATPLASLLA